MKTLAYIDSTSQMTPLQVGLVFVVIITCLVIALFPEIRKQLKK